LPCVIACCGGGGSSTITLQSNNLLPQRNSSTPWLVVLAVAFGSKHGSFVSHHILSRAIVGRSDFCTIILLILISFDSISCSSTFARNILPRSKLVLLPQLSIDK
jgi:hypothetical protein